MSVADVGLMPDGGRIIIEARAEKQSQLDTH